MALLVLVILGASMGWFSSILARTENPSDILRQIAVGLAAALLAGLLANGGVMLGGLSLLALGAGTLGGIAALFGYHALISRGGQIEV